MIVKMKHVILNHSYGGHNIQSVIRLRFYEYYFDLIWIMGAKEKQIDNWASIYQTAFRVKPSIRQGK